jgi:hypothetical protein
MKGDIFKMTKETKRPYNLFDLSHSHKTSFKMGKLIPTLCMEALPGDKFNISPESLTRFMPLVSPVMHKFNINHHFFFVPNRLLWEDWDDFISGNGSFTTPYIKNMEALDNVHLAHYLGVPINVGDDDIEINALPFAAYNLIYDDYYRDQRLQSETYISLSEGYTGSNSSYETYAKGECFPRAWGHDYFTSCLPYPQEGSTTTVIPVTNSGDDPYVRYISGAGNAAILRQGTNDAAFSNATLGSDASGYLENIASTNLFLDPNGTLKADISSDAGTISDLRRAIKLQEFLERDARGGLRYIENIYSHFGVKSKDARLQRPEYIGGAKSTVVISEVLSSTETLDSTDTITQPIGSLAGHGIGITGGNRFNYFCEEHGWIICITSVMPESDYYQGLHRQFSRNDRLDYYWHEFANIGEQEVLVQELYAEGAKDDGEDIFGYIPRYSEYKFINNRISGELVDDLDFWHLARQFGSAPTLNDTFIECVPDTRIFADETADHIVAHIHFNIDAFRQMPKFANPQI